jgi:hypothetical protein
MLESSWVAVQLAASWKGLNSMELVLLECSYYTLALSMTDELLNVECE